MAMPTDIGVIDLMLGLPIPEAVIRYANTRGADKILYAGYFPMGLTLERVMTEMRDVPFRDHVWPRFLRENALRVLQLAA